MKSRIDCRSQEELARYLQEMITYFKQYGSIPQERGDEVSLPGSAVTRIRYDRFRQGGSVLITIDWNGGDGR